MGGGSQSELDGNSEADGTTGNRVRMAHLGSQSANQGGVSSSVNPITSQDSVVLALIFARAIGFCNRSQSLEGNRSPEIMGEDSGSQGQIEDPGAGRCMETATIEPESLTKSVDLSQIIPIDKIPPIREAGESSRAKRTSRQCLRLVTCWYSPFAHRVAISLRQKGVRYVVIEESKLNRNDRTLNANPLNKRIPILTHGGRVISESRIIMEYIDEVWPDGPRALLPVDPFERSAARYWSDYIDKKILRKGAHLLEFSIRPLPESLAFPARIPMDIIEIAQRLLQHVGVNVKEVYDSINDALIGLNNAMTVISHGKSFFMGDRLGFVDIVFAPMIPWLQVLQKLDKYKIPDAKMCPRLHEWLSALQKHPSVRPSLQETSPKNLRELIIKRFRQQQR